MNSLSAVLPRGLFEEVRERPSGYRTVQLAIRVSESRKAVRVRYFRWELWLPVKSVVVVWPKYELYAAGWAIDSAKEHCSAAMAEK